VVPPVPYNVENIQGRVFGKLTVLAYAGVGVSRGGRKYHYWLCHCACSPEVTISVKGESLRGGNTQSCGCHKKANQETFGKSRLSHGHSETKEFRAWGKMIARCHAIKDPHYPRWGGRGIFVCERWRNSFAAFLEDMGESPSQDHTLERVDNDGPYCPENCRWAPHAEQARNSRKNRRLSFRGRTMILADWARELGLPAYVLSDRLRRGWSVEEALTRPHSGWGGTRPVRRKARPKDPHSA
jgi:hypothetical protein